ncbi:MAG: glycine cleavage system protein GcvH [Caldisphaeraceae archaeon]|nr:glycine cleavage system protein GcvH [Caldisphaeraceae archaeon]MEB3691202.1 glycine cleavage system protein GcvH [Caldisphaeraceae archaeon]MEB3797687.1 glycine cleavage system protein GcvH [Caldisphaeraceae archaeon]
MGRYEVKVGNESIAIDDSLLYTESDEWVKVEGEKKVRVGISDYAQKQLKDIVGVDLPNVGDEVEKGATLAVLESVKATAEVYSPVKGKVLEVNERLLDEPELLNKEPYDSGWIALIDAEKVEGLMDHKKYAEALKSRK